MLFRSYFLDMSDAELGQEALDLAVSYIRDFLEEMKQIELSS